MKRRFCRAVIIAGLVALSGCAKIHLNCPTDGTQTATIGGSQVGYQLLSMVGTAAKAAGLLGAERAAAPAPAGSTVDYTYVPIFGQDTVSCGGTPTPKPPQ